ncbi:MAG: hypothetical protein MZW92_81960 [Comamonadaceae bacterium]|nr:hypothetical protein [Comamonadaceae bacterium]
MVELIHKGRHADHLNVVDLCPCSPRTPPAAATSASTTPAGSSSATRRRIRASSGGSSRCARFRTTILLADRSSIAAKLRSVQIGDQVRVRGWLAEYEHQHGFAFRRGTSLTRDDTGSGACETIYVQDVEVLRAGGGPWRGLRWPALGLIVAGVIPWLRAPFRAE